MKKKESCRCSERAGRGSRPDSQINLMSEQLEHPPVVFYRDKQGPLIAGEL